MKYIILLFLFFLSTECFAQCGWGRGVINGPNRQSSPNEENLIEEIFLLNDTSGIELVNRQIDSLVRVLTRFEKGALPNSSKLLDIRYQTKYYCALNFEGLDEERIDSLIGYLNNKSVVLKVIFQNCPIKRIPQTLNLFRSLSEIEFNKCDSLVSVRDLDLKRNVFGLAFRSCRMKRLPEGIENFKQLLNLEIDMPFDYKGMDLNAELSRFTKRNNVFNLLINYMQCNEFPIEVTKLTTIRNLILLCRYNGNYPEQLKDLVNLRYICCQQNDSFLRLVEYYANNDKLFFYKPFGFNYDDPEYVFDEYSSAKMDLIHPAQYMYIEEFVKQYTTRSPKRLELRDTGFFNSNVVEFKDSLNIIKVKEIPNSYSLEISVESKDGLSRRRFAEVKDFNWKTIHKTNLNEARTIIDFKPYTANQLLKNNNGIFLAITIDGKIYSLWIWLENNKEQK